MREQPMPTARERDMQARIDAIKHLSERQAEEIHRLKFIVQSKDITIFELAGLIRRIKRDKPAPGAVGVHA